MKTENCTSRAGRIWRTLVNVILYLFLAVCLVTLVLSLASKRSATGAVQLFGRQMLVVQSESMEKCDETWEAVKGYDVKDIPVRSMVFVKAVPEDEAKAAEFYASLKVGDVLTFRYVYVTQETITHRITDITPNERGGYFIRLEGDNKASDAETLTQVIDTSQKNSPNYIIGKVTGQNFVLGVLVSLLQGPVGIICCIIVPCLIIMVLEIIKVIGILTARKKEQQKEEQEAKEQEMEAKEKELEELRRQLEALQEQQPPADEQKP